MASKRKVNTKFLIGFTVVIIGLLVAGVVAKKVFFRKNPDKYLKMAQQSMQAKDYPEAIKNFNTAATLRPSDPAIFIAMGDALNLYTAQSPESAGKDQAAWRRALEIDPRYMPALERLLASVRQWAEVIPSAENFERVEDMAQKMVSAQPDNLEAQASLHMATVQKWLAGRDIEWSDIEKQVAALKQLEPKLPGNRRIPSMIARAYINRGSQLYQRSSFAQANEMFKQAGEVFPPLLAKEPKDAELNFQASQVALLLMQRATEQKTRDSYKKLLEQSSQTALEAVKPQDAIYIDVYSQAAQLAAMTGQPERAIALYQEALKQRPDEYMLKLVLARLLSADTDKRQDAIQLLDSPFTPTASSVGVRSLMLSQLELQRLVQLTDLRLDAAAATSAPEARKALMDGAKETMSRVFDRIGEMPESLKLRGKYQQMLGQYPEAIQTLTKAKDILATQGKPKDDEMLFLLARACLSANQTGQAKSLLNELVERHDRFLPGRLMLAQVLLREGNTDEAAKQVDVLEKIAPNDPQILQLRLATLDAAKDKAKVKEYYERLPEQTREQAMNKARTSMALNNSAEAERLLVAWNAKDPADSEVAQTLARFYAGSDRKTQAMAVLSAALKSHPDDGGLKITLAEIEGKGAQVVTQLVEQEIARIPDEFTREMRYFRLSLSQNKRPEAKAHLDAALKLKPDSSDALEAAFQLALADRNFDEAAKYLEPLVRTGSDKADGTLYKFRFAMAKGDTSAAINLARDLTTKMPEFSMSWLSLAQALQASSQYEEARAAFGRALDKQSDNADAYRGLIESCYSLSRIDEARQKITLARKMFPQSGYFQEAEINHELNYGDPLKALPMRQAAAEANPNDPSALARLGQAYLRVAQVKNFEKDPAGMKQYAAKARDTFIQGKNKWPDERPFYALLADVALFTKDVATGEEALKEFAARDAWKSKPEPYLLLAEFYQRGGQGEKAEAPLRSAWASSNNNVDVQSRLAQYLVATQRFDEALKLLETNSQDLRIAKQKIDVLFAAGKNALAEKELVGLLEKNPKDVQLLNAMAYLHLNSGDFNAAINRANQVLAIQPANTQALLYRGMSRLRQGVPDPDSALRDLILVRQQFPDNVEYRQQVAEAYRMKNDPDNAIAELEPALKQNPDNKLLRQKLVDLYSGQRPARWDMVERLISQARTADPKDVDWLYAEGRIWAARGDKTKALERLKSAVAAAPTNANYVRAYLSVLLDGKNYTQLLAETDRMLAGDLKDAWWVRQYRARALRAQNKKDLAINEYELALRITDAAKDDAGSAQLIQDLTGEIGVPEALKIVLPRAQNDASWQILAAFLYHSIKDDASAITMIEKSLAMLDQLSPAQQDRVLHVAGIIYLMASPKPQVAKAEKIYTKLLDRFPDDVASLNNLACLLAEYGDPPQPQKALQYSQRAYDIMQKSGVIQPYIMDTHGWVLTLNGRTQEGIILLKQVIERRRLVDSYYHLGYALLKNNLPQDALIQLQTARELVSEMERTQQEVDPTLKARIEKALSEARLAGQTLPGLSDKR